MTHHPKYVTAWSPSPFLKRHNILSSLSIYFMNSPYAGYACGLRGYTARYVHTLIFTNLFFSMRNISAMLIIVMSTMTYSCPYWRFKCARNLFVRCFSDEINLYNLLIASANRVTLTFVGCISYAAVVGSVSSSLPVS